MPSWEWPEGTGRQILGILRDSTALFSDRLLAAKLAGDYTIINDELAEALRTILASVTESEDLRGRAAISLGPTLEQADIDGFENPGDVPITEETFTRIQKTMFRLYMDAGLPKEVRRRTLEAAVRAPQDWHENAVREAYSAKDEAWNLTAVFCMRFLSGFDAEILESLESKNPDIQYQAVCAAGNWGVAGAWPHIAQLLTSETAQKPLLLAAIEAIPGVRPEEARDILGGFLESEDEDIVVAAYEAIAMSGGEWEDEDYDEEEEDDEDDKNFH